MKGCPCQVLRITCGLSNTASPAGQPCKGRQAAYAALHSRARAASLFPNCAAIREKGEDVQRLSGIAQSLPTAQDQAGVGAAKTKAVGQHRGQIRIARGLHDGHAFCSRVQVLDVG